jgi:4,5-dihydroxyphthalate decarboxylase
MPRLAITLACRDYDHTRALLDGKVPVEGVDLRFICLSRPSEIFLRMLRDEEFGASEMSLSNYLISLARGDRRFVAIPIFPSRLFRHSNIRVNSKAGIREPRDLVGKRVGIPDYSMTALLFIRGMLKHQHGVLPEDIRWFRQRSEHVSIEMPPGIRIENIVKDQTIDGLLEEGKLDAVMSTSEPRSVGSRSPLIRRLFQNPRDVEAEYYRQTQIFPIMHIIVIRRAIYDRNPWLAVSLSKAFQLAKKQAYARFAESLYPMPWFNLDLDFAKQVLGDDIYPYGVKQNLPTLEAATLFAHEQGLTARRLEVKELFAPETLDLFAHAGSDSHLLETQQGVAKSVGG